MSKLLHRFLLITLLPMLLCVATASAQVVLQSTGSGLWSNQATWESTNLTGSISTSTASAIVTGTGTLFSTELASGDVLLTSASTILGTVISVDSDTQLTLSVNASANTSSITFRLSRLPNAMTNVRIQPGHNINLNTNAEALNLEIEGTLQCVGGAARTITVNGDLSGTGTLNMGAGNLAHQLILLGVNNSIGAFSAGTATEVRYQRNGAQQIFSSDAYAHIFLSNAGEKTLNGNVSLSGNLTVSNPASLSFGTSIKILEVQGDLLAAGATINMSGATHQLLLFGANNAVNTFTTTNNGQIVKYGRNGNQQVFASTLYRNIEFLGSGIKTLQGNVTTTNAVTIADGVTVAFGNATVQTLQIGGNLAAANATIDMTGGTFQHVLRLGGTNNALGTLNTNTNNQRVEYYRNSAQQIFASSNYRILHTSGGNIKTLQGPVTVASELRLTNGVLALANHDLTLLAAASVGGNAPSATNMVATIGTGSFVKNFNASLLGTFTFPIGSNARYAPATLSGLTTLSAGSISMRTVGSKLIVPPLVDNSNALQRYWISSTSYASTPAGTLTLDYHPAEADMAEDAYQAGFYNGTTWNTTSGTVNSGADRLSWLSMPGLNGT